MAKQIIPIELAEIVCALIVKPQLLGELDSSERYAAFLEDIGQVVATHCGGEVTGVSFPDFEETLESDDPMFDSTQPMLSVHPNECLPSLNRNVWSAYDEQGWEGELASDYNIVESEPMNSNEVSCTRMKCRSVFTPSNQMRHRYAFSLVDWRVVEDTELDEKGDDKPILVTIQLGNQPSLEFLDADNNSLMGVLMEIDKGVPTLHVDLGGDSVLHCRALPVDKENQSNQLLVAFDNCNVNLAPISRYQPSTKDAYLLS